MSVSERHRHFERLDAPAGGLQGRIDRLERALVELRRVAGENDAHASRPQLTDALSGFAHDIASTRAQMRRLRARAASSVRPHDV